MFTKRKVIALLFSAVVAVAIWQNYQLLQERKAADNYLATAGARAAYFLWTSKSSMDQMNNNNTWDDPQTRQGLSNWLTMSGESITAANTAWQAFPSHFKRTAREDMNSVFFLQSQWISQALPILDNKGPMTAEDKYKLLSLSRVVGKVKGLYPRKNDDLKGIEDAITRLNKEWVAETTNQ